MAKATKVTAIEITVSGKTIRLSMDEAQELHKSLNKLFGEVIKYVPEYRPYRIPYWEWTYPDWTVYGTSAAGSFGTSNQMLFSCSNEGVVSL